MTDIGPKDLPPGKIQSSDQVMGIDSSGFLYRDIFQSLNSLNLHTGIINGLVKTPNADPTLFDIAAGNGIIIDKTDPQNTIINRINIPDPIIGIPNPHLTSTVSNVLIDAAKVVTVINTTPTMDDIRNKLSLGGMVKNTAAQEILFTIPNPIVAYGSSATEIERMFSGGGITYSGGMVTPAGPNLTLDIERVIVEQFGRGHVLNPVSPNIVDIPAKTPIPAANFFKVFTEALGDLNIDNSTNTLSPTLFNEDGAGTLQTISPNNYTTIRGFASAVDNNVLFYYGTEEFSTIIGAVAAAETTFVENSITRGISPVVKIHIKENVTDLTQALIDGDVIFQPITSRTQL